MPSNRIRFSNDFVLRNSQVGFGTSTPRAKLDVIGSALVAGSLGVSSSVTITGNLGVGGTITNPTFTGIATFIGITTQNSYAGLPNTNAVEVKAYARDNGTLSFNGYGNQILTLNDNFTTDAFVVANYIPKPYSYIQGGLFSPTDFIEQAFRIDSSGNIIVGIGAAIAAKFDVRGPVVLGTPYTSLNYTGSVAPGNPHTLNGDVNINGQIRPRRPFQSSANYVAMSPTTDDTGALNFYTGTASTTQLPNQILSLTNNVVGSLFRVNDPVVVFGSATNLSISQTFNALLEVNSNGNVGVGTSIPTTKLHVVGNALITGITTVGLGSTSSPTINSTMSFELTNNTTLTVRVRGTDGQIRTGIITLAP